MLTAALASTVAVVWTVSLEAVATVEEAVMTVVLVVTGGAVTLSSAAQMMCNRTPVVSSSFVIL